MNRSILLRSILFLLSALLIFILVYLLYVIISYQRIPDNQEISVRQSTQTPTSLSTSTPYTAVTYNLGFGAYTPSFTFFMDGGKQSVAESKESVLSCIQGAINTMETQNADFILLQEIDVDSTRSHHVNEKALLEGAFSSYHASFAFNYNSAYLLVPPWEPHGKSLSGLELFLNIRLLLLFEEVFQLRLVFLSFLIWIAVIRSLESQSIMDKNSVSIPSIYQHMERMIPYVQDNSPCFFLIWQQIVPAETMYSAAAILTMI